MTEIPLLGEIALITAIGVVVTVLLGRLRLPTVAGLLLSGGLIGPGAFGLIADTHAIESIAEVGVVLLLFTIGLEFSLERLASIFRTVALGGALQVGGTLLIGLLASLTYGRSFEVSLFFGFAIALSSTAVVLRILTDRRELDAPHGRFIVGTLIFQDLCVVPLVLLVPLLGPNAPDGGGLAILLALGKATLVVGLVLGLARVVVPRVLRWVDASRSDEVFLLAVLSLCVGTAWLTASVGSSLALGAFLGGVVVAGTEFRHRALGDVLPLRNIFVSLFFVSLGMFFDPQVLAERPLRVLVSLGLLLVGKTLIATFAALVMRFPPRAAWLAGVGLAQFSEFGLVLVQLGLREQVVTREQVGPLLDAGVLSMFFTPLLVHWAPHFTAGERILTPLARRLRARTIEEKDRSETPLGDHVVVIGYGLAGEHLSRVLRQQRVRHVVLDVNAENVRRGRLAGQPVFYADATSAEALTHAHLAEARAVVLLINDPLATPRILAAIRRLAPTVPLYVRTHYAGNAAALLAAGATDVVSEELEGLAEILARTLRELEVPRNRIDEEIEALREETQHSARSHHVVRAPLEAHRALGGMKVESLLLDGESQGLGRSPRSLRLREATGATILALRRGTQLVSPVPPDENFAEGDLLYLLGGKEQVRAAMDSLDHPVET